MKQFSTASLLALWALTAACAAGEPAAKLTYPVSVKEPVVDDYHGTKVPDPYRWLEELDADRTRAWIEDQNKVTFGYLNKLPGRDWIRDHLTRIWDFEKYEIPVKEGGRYFYARNNGIQNQSVIYTLESLTGEPRVLLDPNATTGDAAISLSTFSVARDGKHLAYLISRPGSDWQEWKVRTIPGGKDLPDQLRWVKLSMAAWRADSSGFFYSRYDEPHGAVKAGANFHQKLYYHQLNTPQAADTLVYQRKDQKEWGFEPTVSEDGRYLIIHVWKGTDPKGGCFYLDLSQPTNRVVELLNAFDASYVFVGNDGPIFWFLVDKDAPRQRVVAIDIRAPDKANWKVIIPEAADALVDVKFVNDKFIASYLKDASSRVVVFGRDGKELQELPLPGIGTAEGFSGHASDTDTFYAYASFPTPREIWHLDLTTGKAEIFKRPKLAFDPSELETRQVFYTSKDGTRVPMFVSGKKGFQADGKNPVLLFGYGGFNLNLTPAFYVENLVWMQMGGLYASPNIRGGGEYGEEWHQNGIGPKKQNGIDDFVAAAEWLIENKYTTRELLGIHGRSNGGLLVGAVMTQRPDLCACVLAGVGVFDMLRYHLFTIGWAWAPDYGTSDTPEGFATLYRYSPLHALKKGTAYPAALITTGDHDDRAVPGHSYKFAATLQECQAGAAPVLIRVDVKAGQGSGKPTSKRIEEAVDRLSFLADIVQLKLPQAPPK